MKLGEGGAVSHSGTDVMTPVAWPAADVGAVRNMTSLNTALVRESVWLSGKALGW